MRRENITQGRIIAKFNELIGAIVTHYECYHFVCKQLQCSVCGIIFKATGGRWGTHLRARERRDWQRADDAVVQSPMAMSEGRCCARPKGTGEGSCCADANGAGDVRMRAYGRLCICGIRPVHTQFFLYTHHCLR